MIPHFGDQNMTCWRLAEEKNAVQSDSSRDGIIVYYTSLKWCTENCSFKPPITTDFLFVFMGFALPAVIFSTVIPRRWRLDVLEQLFKLSRRQLFSLSKLFLSIPAVCIVATFDIIGWIICIMTFAGPMVFSGVQEMLLDFRGVSFLKGSEGLPAREKLEVVVSLLCGNFDQDSDDPKSRIHNVLIPSELTEESLQSSKSRLITIMNAQTSFGMTIGIPTIFFLGGFLYNVTQAPSPGAIPFGILWMVLVVVTIVSGTLLAGNSPNTVSVLVINNYIRARQTRRLLFRDMYDSELYPVSMWDRGFNKYQWLKNSALWQDPRGIFRQRMELRGWSWVVIAMDTYLLLASPCLLAWSFDYLIPWPWFGCLSLLYLIYLVTQTLLIFAALALANIDVLFHTVWRPWELVPKGNSRSIFLLAALILLTSLAGAASVTAAFFTIFGSVYQFSDRFDTCFCSMPVSSWMLPVSQQLAFVSHEVTSPSYGSWLDNVSFSLPLGAAMFTCIVCFLGWWYQRALRAALKDIINEIEH
jgi:hypothetical protein